jgi:DNA polymerase I-like protein with 3'-5' exonuclease and polymerase domains
MQLPKDREFMGCFVAPPGHKLVYTDIAALEPHVLAHFSQDAGMMGLYGPDAKASDVYLHVGAHTDKWGPAIRKYFDPADPTPESIAAAKKHCYAERKAVKPVYLGWSYGLGARTMNTNTQIPIEECKVILENINKAFPGTVQFAEALREVWCQNGGWAKVEWQELEDGRVKPVTVDGRPGWILNGRNRPLAVAPEKRKDLVNRFVQSTGHDVMLQLLVFINKLRLAELPEMRPYHVDLHDATIWAVPEEKVGQAKQIYETAYQQLNDVLGWTVQIKGDIEVGQSLADFLEE